MLLDEATDIEILIFELEEDELPCEAPNKHAKGVQGHEPGAPAEFLAIRPCGCPDFLLCRGAVLWLSANLDAYATCTSCLNKTRIRFYRFLPLN